MSIEQVLYRAHAEATGGRDGRAISSVGMPLDVAIIRGDSMEFATQRRIDADDPNFSEISDRWSEALRNAFQTLPEMTDD